MPQLTGMDPKEGFIVIAALNLLAEPQSTAGAQLEPLAIGVTQKYALPINSGGVGEQELLILQ